MLYNGCVHNVSASSENLRDNDGKDLMQKPQMFKVQKKCNLYAECCDIEAEYKIIPGGGEV